MASPFANHDPKVISVFEIVGSYYTDVVFNHVYASARANLAGGASITDGYVHGIQAFVLGTKNDERCYADVVQGIHKYFGMTTRYTALSFADFVDRIVGACVPEEYFRQFAPQDKDELLSSILCDLVSNLAAFATKPEILRRIIDEHDRSPMTTIRMLQDAAVNALIAKRASLHNKFLRKAGQARDQVPMDMLDDMKRALRRLAKEKAEAVARAEDAEEALADLKSTLRESKTREAKLHKLVGLLRQGRDLGPAAAGAGLRVPARDTIAEDPRDAGPRRGGRPPRRERIAERRGESESSGESEYSDESESEYSGESEYSDEEEASPPRPRGGRRPPARGARPPSGRPQGGGHRGGGRPPPASSAMPANFFKGPAAPLAGGVTAASLRAPAAPFSPPGAEALGGRHPDAQRRGPEGGQPPPMLLNLLDNTVDVGDDYLNDLLA